MKQNHIFVCGGGHSGTTLLLAILDSHSEIAAVPVETGVFHRLRDDAELLSEVEQWRARFAIPDVRYVAEKTPVHVRYLARIFTLFPGAKVIFMTRDGRDASISSAKRLGDYSTAAKQWVTFNRAYLDFPERHRVLAVRYEDLVGNTRAAAERICAYLGLAFDAAMLSHHERRRTWWDSDVRPADNAAPLVGDNHKRNRNWQINQPLFNATGRWRNDTTPEELAIFQGIAAKTMRDLGYSLEN